MKTKKALILLFGISLLLNASNLSPCSEGCLSCKPDSSGEPKCLMCDHFNFYRLSTSGVCFKLSIENCEIPSANPLDRACDLCLPGFFLDNTRNKCSEVPDKFQVEACRRYHWEYSCSECNDDFYLMDNTCLPVSAPIEKCKLYADAKTCKQCEWGHFLNIGTKTCDPIKTKSGCLVYSSVQCTQCASGHFKMDNAFSNLTSSPTLLQTWTSYSSDEMTETNLSIFEPKPANHCVEGTVENCLRHSSFDECAECQSDYFLSPSKTCELFPIRTVAHCQAYKSANNCSRCNSGYYLNDNVCHSLDSVSGCLEFDPITEDCLKCDNEKYFFDSGSCGKRENSMNISFCDEVSEDDDFCVKCLPSFKLTDDKLKCLPHIPHCQQYVSDNTTTDEDFTNINTLELKCVTCDDHFYLSVNKKACLVQNSPGCTEFDPSTNDCTECASGYFLNDSACELYTQKFCKSFKSTADECESCFDGFFFSGTTCTRYTARNCLTYETDSDNCETCLKQYYLSTDSITSQVNCEILTKRNCKSYKETAGKLENECEECYQGYKLHEKECVLVSLINCAVQTPTSDACQTCKPGHFNDSGTCKPYTVKNCDDYVADSDGCSTCAANFGAGDKRNMFYKTSDNDCLPYTVLNCETKVDDENKCATCPSASWYIDAHGDCIASNLKHCSTLDSANPGQCQTCADGFKLSSGRCFKVNLPGCIDYTEENCETCAGGFYKSSNKCHPYTVVNCATYNTTADACATCLPGFKIDGSDCVFFHEDFCMTFNTSGVCLECNKGYWKDTSSCEPQDITNCAKFTPNQNHCMECHFGYSTTDGTSCNAVNPLFGCMDVDPADPAKCKGCFRGYKLNTTAETCSVIPEISNCIQYESNTGLCEACSFGMIPNNFKTACESISLDSVSNCYKFNQDDGSCMACEAGYYLESPSECKSQSVENCMVYKTNENNCVQCESNYKVENGNCMKLFEDSNCIKYNSSRTACEICDTDYYPDEGVCYKNILGKCTMKMRNKNQCISCEENYTLGSTKDCEGFWESPTDENCLVFSKESFTCEVCKSSFYLQNGVCTLFALDPDDFILDPDCAGTFTQNAQCGYCPQGNKSFPLTIITLDTTDYAGCAKVDTTNGQCTQCQPNYDRLSADKKSCQSSGTSSNCKQLKVNTAVDALIDSNGNCAECRDQSQYYLNGDSCTPSKQANVDKVNVSDGTPQICTTDGLLTTLSDTTTFECGTINTVSAEIPNCAEYKYEDPSICYKCDYDAKSSGGGSTCTTQSPTIISTLHIRVNSVNNFEVSDYNEPDAAANASVLIDITETTSPTFYAGICNGDSAYQRIVDLSTLKQMNYDYGLDADSTSYASDKVSFANSYPVFTCETTSTKFLSNTTTNPAIAGDTKCTYWAKRGDYLKCMGCQTDFLPELAATTHEIDNGTDATISTTIEPQFKSVITACTAPGSYTLPTGYVLTGIAQNYQGLGYHTQAWLSMSTFIRFDSCGASKTPIIVFAKKSGQLLFPNAITSSFNVVTGAIPNIICYDLTAKGTDYLFAADVSTSTTDPQGGITNCQIHLWIEQGGDMETGGVVDTQITSGDAAGSRLSCLACKPGFTGFASGSKYQSSLEIASCGAIANCDTTAATNTWMNACQTCSGNNAWELTSDKELMFHRCVAPSSNSTSNCLFYELNSSNVYECRACKSTFMLQEVSGVFSCVSKTTYLNCTTIGRSKLTLPKHATLAGENALVFQYFINGVYSSKYVSCESCSSGYKFYRTFDSTPTLACTFDFNLQNNKSDTPDAALDGKCKVYNGDYTTCSVCIDDGGSTKTALNTTSKCSDKPNNSSYADRVGCSSINENDSNKCVGCHDGYTAMATASDGTFCYNQDELDTEMFCSTLIDSSGPYCSVCKSGYLPDQTAGNEHLCTAAGPGVCNRGNRDGTCTECNDANHFPIHYSISGATSNPYYNFECVDQGSSDFDKFGLTNVYFNVDTKTLGTITTNLPNDTLYIKDVTKTIYNTFTGNNHKDVCLKVIDTPFENCLIASEYGIKCQKCKKGYQLIKKDTEHNECVPIFTRCLTLHPNGLDCLMCKPEYVMDHATNQCLPRTMTGYTYDSDVCVGNFKTDYSCDKCLEGNQATEIKYAVRNDTFTNCLVTDPDTGNCTMCDLNFDYQTAGITCAATSDTACRLLKYPLTTTATMDTDDCASCNPGYLRWQSSPSSIFECKEIKAYPNTNNMSFTSPSTFAYVGCFDWATHITTAPTKNMYECAYFTKTDQITAITDCAAYNTDGTCALCDEGKSFNAAGNSGAGSCDDDTDVKIILTLDNQLTLKNHKVTTLNTANENLGYAYQVDTYAAVQCKYANRLNTIIYGPTDTDFPNRNPYKPRLYSDSDTVDTTNVEFTRSYPGVTCTAYVAATHGFAIGAAAGIEAFIRGTPATPADSHCALFEKPDDNYKCARCYDGYIPNLVEKANILTNDGTSDVTTPYTKVAATPSDGGVIESCVLSSAKNQNSVRLYQGLSYGNLTVYPAGAYLSVDHCTGANEYLLVIGTWGTKGKYNPIYFTTDFSSATFTSDAITTNQFCVTVDDTNYYGTAPNTNKYQVGVTDCQINALEQAYTESTPPVINKFSTAPTLKCLSCRPGYSSTYDSDNKFIQTCTPIDNCDVSDDNTNTWMNACKVCQGSHAWTFNSTTKMLNLHECANTSLSNCMVVDKTTTTECVLCNNGFILKSDGKCVADGVLTKKGCTDKTSVFPHHNMDIAPSSPNADSEELRGLDFINFLYILNTWVFKPNCVSCDASSTLIKFGTADTAYCSNHATNVNWTSVPGITDCIHYDPQDSTKCIKCRPNYVVVTGSHSATNGTTCQGITGPPVTANPLLAQCQAVNSTSDYHCVKCLPDMQSIASTEGGGVVDHACYDVDDISNLNCARFDYLQNECLVCNENHKFDTNHGSKFCIAEIPATDDKCSMPATNGRCLKCKGAQYYPFHWKLETPENGNDYKFYCINNGRTLDNEFFYMVHGFDLVTRLPFTDTTIIPWNNHYAVPTDYTTYTGATFSEYTNMEDLKYVCLKIKDSENFVECEELGQFGHLCSKCNSSYALFDKNKTFNECFTGCAATDPLTNHCVLCSDATKHTNNQTSKCESTYTTNVDNCNYKSPFANICIYCNSGYYMNSSSQCVQYSAMNHCVNRDRFSDKCVLCEDGYTLLATGKCQMYQQDKCNFVNPDSLNECLSCVSGFDLVNGKCLTQSPLSSICKTRDDDGKCASCFNGFTLNHGTCNQTFSAMSLPGCLTYDKTGRFCEACELDMDLSNGRCVTRKLSNCEVKNTDGTICELCVDGYYLDGSGCSPRTNLGCEKYAKDKNACLSCAAGNYLLYGKCMNYTATNCQLYNPVKDSCLTCDETFHMDYQSGRCQRSSLDNCQVLNYLNNECFSCINGYFLNNEGLCSERTITTCAQFDPYADSCVDCPEGFYLIEDNGFLVDSTTNSLNTCKPYTLTNCQTYHAHEDSCLSCNEGESLNGDNHCLPRTVFNCAAWNKEQTECTKCPKGSFLKDKACHLYSVSNCASFNQHDNACVTCPQKFYLSGKDCLPYTVSDCLYYEDKQDKCTKCATGFFNRSGACYKITQNNCSTHSGSKNECTTCMKGYYLQNGACLSYTISCMDYSSNSNECISCPSGQYLEGNNKTCVLYTVTNCQTFSGQSNHCETCVDNHYFSGGLCLPYTVNNCNVYHSLFDECVTCQSGFYHHQKKCLPYNVSNCSKYSLVSDICLACLDGHYNSRGNCIPYNLENCETPHEYQNSCLECESKMFYRLEVKTDLFLCKPVTEVEECDEYEPHHDKCLVCEEDYYLDESTNTCNEVPPTVTNCAEFSDETTCKSCISPYYLMNNECHKTDHLIAQCVKYASNAKCSECEQSSMLSDDSTLCLKISEPTCETYLDPNNCKTCAGNNVISYINDVDGQIVSGLNGEDLTNLRTICANSGISDCAIARKAFPNNTCIQCDSGYFFSSNNSCDQVTQTIDNCETYFEDGICSQCTNNHVLSFDKTECHYNDSFLGKNCQEGKFLSQPQCFMCQTGYYFDSNGDCVACVVEGCAVCSLEESASCRVCKKGYYMNEEMRCVLNEGLNSRMKKEIADSGVNVDMLQEMVSAWNVIFVSLLSILSLF